MSLNNVNTNTSTLPTTGVVERLWEAPPKQLTGALDAPDKAGDVLPISRASIQPQGSPTTQNKEGSTPRLAFIEIHPDEDKALRMVIEAESLPKLQTGIFKALPYFVTIGLFLAPAYPQPSQGILAGYSVAWYLGYSFKVTRKNGWFTYNYFLSPLVIAAVSKSAPLCGQIILCQLAFRKDVGEIEDAHRTVSSFVSNTCSHYRNNNALKTTGWGWLALDLMNLGILLVLLYGGWRNSNNFVWKPLKRLHERMGPEAPDEEA